MDLSQYLAQLATLDEPTNIDSSGVGLPPQAPVDPTAGLKPLPSPQAALPNQQSAAPESLPAAATAASNASDTEDDEDEKSPGPGGKSPAPTPSAASSSATPAAPSAYDAVRDMIAKKYGIGDDKDALAAAQAKARAGVASANMGDAFGSIINGMSGGHAPVDTKFYDSLREQTQTPVKNLIQQRAFGEENLKNAKGVQDLTTETIENDPASPMNQSFRTMLQKIPAFKGINLDGVTVRTPGIEKFGASFEAAEARKVAMAQINEYRQQRLSQQQERLDESIHQRNLMAIKRDPNLRNRMQQYQNLDNAMNLITQAKDLTPQQIDDFQQAVRANLGIKGSSGVDERGKTYINTLGLNSARFGQFLTGSPADLAKNSKLMQHLRDLAVNEQKNIQSQYLNSLKAAGSGNDSFYRRRADLAGDLQGLFQANQDQLSSKVGGSNSLSATGAAPAPSPAAPPGKIKVSNGKKSFFIDPSDLAHAQADGFNPAQ